MNLRLRFFIQWSQLLDRWECISCKSYAAGVEYYKLNKKGERKKYVRQEYDTIMHTLRPGDGNRLVHQQCCKFFVDYVAELPSASAMVS